MKKSILIFTFAIAFYFLERLEKSVTHYELKEEKSIEQSPAEYSLAEFQDDLGSWNACIVYDGKEYTNLDDFLNKDK